jgi:A/G-specific adenine glycosylase
MKNTDQAMPDADGSIFLCSDSPGNGICEFQQMVLSYFLKKGRKMPWREKTDPYHILVSEIMLQQTQVERVLKKFPEFIRIFPDFGALAAAPLADILAVWQGMGYNRRAITLQKCAILVMKDYQGHLPDNVETLETFPGIGRATAGSIAAFAFNIPVVFIETNIRRVFIHFFFPGSATVDDAEILPLVEQTMYRKNPRVWYWALMDLGTSLKNTVSNPNRRSSHYYRQPSFNGSDRKIRGRILKILLEEHFMEDMDFAVRLGENPVRIKRILVTLESEGFIQRTGPGYQLKNTRG